MFPANKKYSPEIARRIVALLQDGNYIKVACADAGISYKTYKEWIRRGNGPDAREPYATFSAVCAQARARAETDAIRTITAHGQRDWRALAWKLERMTCRERWKPPTTKVEAKVEAEATDVRDALLAEAEALVGLGPAGLAPETPAPEAPAPDPATRPCEDSL